MSNKNKSNIVRKDGAAGFEKETGEEGPCVAWEHMTAMYKRLLKTIHTNNGKKFTMRCRSDLRDQFVGRLSVSCKPWLLKEHILLYGSGEMDQEETPENCKEKDF